MAVSGFIRPNETRLELLGPSADDHSGRIDARLEAYDEMYCIRWSGMTDIDYLESH